MSDIAGLLDKPEFPRSSRYDPVWMLQNQMGPNALWLAEWLTEAVPLQAGRRVLDLGCGRAMTSIFMDREFGARGWEVDWWIAPDSNRRRVLEAGVADSVFPLRAEAHALPLSAGFFDVIVSWTPTGGRMLELYDRGRVAGLAAAESHGRGCSGRRADRRIAP